MDARPRARVDALAYVDTHVDSNPQRRARATQMIQEEMNRTPDRPSLALPPTATPNARKRLAPPASPEEARGALAAKRPHPQQAETADASRKPEDSRGKPSSSPCLALEYERIRATNLEIIQKFGASSRRTLVELGESVVARLEAEINRVQSETNQVNKQRKHWQLGVGKELAETNEMWGSSAFKLTNLRRALAARDNESPKRRRHSAEEGVIEDAARTRE